MNTWTKKRLYELVKADRSYREYLHTMSITRIMQVYGIHNDEAYKLWRAADAYIFAEKEVDKQKQ